MSISDVTNFIFQNQSSSAQPSGKMFGVAVGIVTNNKDPDKAGRIKVQLKWLSPPAETDWCRLAVVWGGKERGMLWIPEVDDEVLVAFEHGDLRFPYIVGSLWGTKKKACLPADKNKTNLGATDNDLVNQDGKNNHKYIRSREGHEIHVDDTEGAGGIMLRTSKGHEVTLWDEGGEERIRIFDKDMDNYVDISTVDKKITIETKTGDILIKAKKTITLECKDFELKAEKTCKSEAGTTWDQKSGSGMKVEAGSSMDTKSGSGMKITAGGTMEQKAPTIKLN